MRLVASIQVACRLLLQVFISACLQQEKSKKLVPASSDPSVERQDPLNLPLTNPLILVKKSNRTLQLFAQGTLVRTYRIGLGFDPVADKEGEGDGRTPEGEFYVFTKNPTSSYYLSLAVSYPNREDAERGLRDYLISRREHDEIVKAIKQKTAPPQYTKLGGLIYIHGHGAGSDWTLGCIGLENDDIKELYEIVSVGTAIKIDP